MMTSVGHRTGLFDAMAGLVAAWGRERARRYLEEAGFSGIEVGEVPDDPTTDVWVARVG